MIENIDERDIARLLITVTSDDHKDFLEKFKSPNMVLFNTDNEERIVIINSASLKQLNKNMLNASKNRKRWANEEMTLDEFTKQVKDMNLVLKAAIVELQLTDPELVEDVNNFNSNYLNEIVNSKIIGKLFIHWEDFFPGPLFGEFSVLKSKEDIGISSNDIFANDRKTIVFEQIRNIIDSPDVIKMFGVTIRSANSQTQSIYLPVIHCYHPKSGLNIMIQIPNKKILSGFSLDIGQALFLEYFKFVPPRIAEKRVVDKALKSDNPEPYFPILFLKSKIPLVDWFMKRLSEKRK